MITPLQRMQRKLIPGSGNEIGLARPSTPIWFPNARVSPRRPSASRPARAWQRHRSPRRRSGPRTTERRPDESVTLSPYAASRTTRPRARSSLSTRPAGSVVEGDLEFRDEVASQRAGGVQGHADRVAVRPDQSARSEQGAAEPAGDDGGDVRDAGAAEHLEHRRPGRARGLAVVGGPLQRGIRAEHERRAVVPRVPVLLAQVRDERPGSAPRRAHVAGCTGSASSSPRSPPRSRDEA